ncbi:MAG: DUF5121 domain-containing protein [Clostridium sp.]|nr:DUF5121 domain-containing protein [Prevotella sp.]MCM1429534.1 DUF5121 domain-containing protein [Clostridium sp.]MCM1476150.1 DUF5121 domain-containing protein [Muribaculaceae bacterium]
MKYSGIFALLLGAGALLTACSDDDLAPGNPIMNVSGNLDKACFGDSLAFTVKATDNEVPLSTIHAELFFGDEKVSERVIRTKVSGADYESKIYVPYYANIPDGRATLKLTLQNIHFTTTEEVYEVMVSHADYPSLTFRAEDGTEYTMDKSEQNVYSMTKRFPATLKGQIIAPKMGDNGNEIVFGYENSEIKPGAEGLIPFSNSAPGRYTISFNTFSFEGSPFVVMSLNGEVLQSTGESTAQIDMNLSKGDVLTPEGFPNFTEWWINPDYFLKNEDGSLTFNAYNGNYRIIADTKAQYFRVYKLNGNDPATLNNDGTGALWIIGDGIGHPTLANQVGWTTENAICMAPVGEKTYQVTLVGGKTVAVDKINFKFFGQMGWGVELTGSDLVSKSDLIGVGTGDNDHDNGNLFLKDGVVLQANGVYVLTVDLTQGIHDAVMTVDYNGEQQFEERPISLNGQKMSTSDNVLYSTVIEMNQNSKLSFKGFTALDGLYYDPDYFYFDEDAFEVSFLPVKGYYNIILNRGNGTLSAKRVNADGSDMTLQDNGTGGLWLMGWGVGSPSMDHQFGWDPGKAYCLAEIKPGIFQFTGQAGPEVGSRDGDRFRFDYLSFKFFYQNGWGGEFGEGALKMIGNTSKLLKNSGNFELADGTQLKNGATYRVTIDLSKGITNGTINMSELSGKELEKVRKSTRHRALRR